MSDPAEEVKIDPASLEGLEEVFDLAGTPGTESGATEGTARTPENDDPGQPGHDSVEAADVATYISTADAAKLAAVDSRTIRRWYEQKKVRGQLSKGKLLVVQEDLLPASQEPELFSAGTPGTESGTVEGTARTPENDDPGQPGQTADIPQTPAVVFFEFVDRIERLSRENGELRALLDEQLRENQQLKLLTDREHKTGFWSRFYSWMIGGKK